MLGTVACSRGWDGENWQVRTELQPERVCIDQPDTDLAALFWYWQERSLLEDAVPSIENFRIPGLDLPWVELSTENPMHYVMRNHPAGITGDWSDTRLAEHPVSIHAQSCAFEYLDCKERKYPTFVHINQKVIGVERNYVRLAAPVSDEGGTITRIYYAFRFVTFPVIHGGLS